MRSLTEKRVPKGEKLRPGHYVTLADTRQAVSFVLPLKYAAARF